MAIAVPTDYRKPQSELIYDLIEKTNPGFKAAYPLGSVTFSAPVAIAVDSADPYKRDTSIIVTPTAASGGIGSATVTYRRVDLTKLFKGMTLSLDNYHTANPAPASVWLSWFSVRYGFNLTVVDFNSPGAIVSGNGATSTVANNSLCYKGQITVAWTLGKRPMSDLFTDANRALTGRLYPGGNDFTTPGRKPQGEFLTYCQNASSIASTLETLTTNGSLAPTNPIVVTTVDFLLANTIRTDWAAKSAAEATPGGISNLNWFRYTLPNAAIPEANSTKYNRCIVIQSLAGSWFAGKIIIHYNV